jgi:hypothetical protein
LTAACDRGLRRGQRVEDQRVDAYARALDAAQQVVDRRAARGHHVRLDVEPRAEHPERVDDVVLPVDDVVARHDVQHLAVVGDVHDPRALQRALDVADRDRLPRVRDRDDPARVHGGDVRPRHADVGGEDARARGALGALDRGGDRLHRGVDVVDHAARQPLRGPDADAEDADLAGLRDLGDHGADLGRAHVDCRERRVGHQRITS